MFFFLQDVIELIVWFCVDYFYGHVFFYAFIKAKKKIQEKTLQIFLRSINSRIKVIDTVDDHLKKNFFSPNGLAQFGWCAKYVLYSDFSVKLLNKLKTQVVQFIWFRNLYRHKLCPCFICDSFKSKYDC